MLLATDAFRWSVGGCLALTCMFLLMSPLAAQPLEMTRLDVERESRRFFFLINPVDPRLSGTLVSPPIELADGTPPPPASTLWVEPPAISDLTVWLDDGLRLNDNVAIPGILYLDPTRPGLSMTPAHPDSLAGFFDVLTEHVDYAVREDVVTFDDRGSAWSWPVVDLGRSLGDDERLGAVFRATYRLPDGAGGHVDSVVAFGSLPGTTVRMKTIGVTPGDFPSRGEVFDPDDFWTPVRRLEPRGVYRVVRERPDTAPRLVTVRTVAGDDHLPGRPDATYARMLGVDRRDVSGLPGADGLVDAEFLLDDNLLVLPDLRPFAPSAIDSVWPFFVADLAADPAMAARPAIFTGDLANPSPYDRRTVDPVRHARYRVDSSVGAAFDGLTSAPSPNPFSVTTQLFVNRSRGGTVRATVYSVMGHRLYEQENSGPPGLVTLSWDGRSDGGARLASGIYWLRVELDGAVETRKLILMR